MDEKQWDGVSAIGAVVDEVKGHGISRIRVWIQRDSGGELLVTMDTINPDVKRTQCVRLRIRPG